MIQDYLSSQNYDYTLCTLACESGLPHEAFSVQDVERLLHITHAVPKARPKSPILQYVVDQMMRDNRFATASAQTSQVASTGAKQCSVDDQLLQLKKAVEDAKEQLECFHGQLNRRKSGTKLDWQERRRQATHQMSVLTQVSSHGTNPSPQDPSARTSSELWRSNEKVSSASGETPPLDRARCRLEHLAIQTDFLDQRFQQIKHDPLAALWVSMSCETIASGEEVASPSFADMG